MDDIYGKVEVFPNHFQDTKAYEDCLQTRIRSDYSLRSHSLSWTVKRVMGATSMLNLFRLPWSSTTDDDKVKLSRAELESLRSEIVDADERESHLKAQLEHLDEILKSVRLSGYLYIRTRWTELPVEPPKIEDGGGDDWLPRFVVLNGSCVYYYLKSTDLSPQDSTVLSDVVEVEQLPSFVLENQQTRYAFYILTCHGLRFECACDSKIQADAWMTALLNDCKFQHGATADRLS
ncbi:nucleoside diphosphate kinase III, chloroplastic/mitochondrial [Iris pallida]|uniref:Nucleoside diphosphate kinase III, chloroplastic/mitochondrial n=1 Tax=Iris pallida TaxID=29817 RepID=A0AAX6EE58_IRIPA|nr:nucleoside diphosphate kinase III, chloroplastic/mitochondrial [Iris pallida]